MASEIADIEREIAATQAGGGGWIGDGANSWPIGELNDAEKQMFLEHLRAGRLRQAIALIANRVRNNSFLNAFYDAERHQSLADVEGRGVVPSVPSPDLVARRNRQRYQQTITDVISAAFNVAAAAAWKNHKDTSMKCIGEYLPPRTEILRQLEAAGVPKHPRERAFPGWYPLQRKRS